MHIREGAGKKILVMVNFSTKNASAKTGINVSKATVLLGNYATPSRDDIETL